MRLIAGILMVALAGCTMAPFRVFMGEYRKAGETTMELSDARNFCSEESLKYMMNSPATGNLSAYLSQKFMLKCMKEKGYGPVDIRPEAFEDPFQVGKP